MSPIPRPVGDRDRRPIDEENASRWIAHASEDQPQLEAVDVLVPAVAGERPAVAGVDVGVAAEFQMNAK